MSEIGARLRSERERLGLSQAAFGTLGGVKGNAQGNYEKGDRYPDAAYLAAISSAGVDVLYVLTGERHAGSADAMSEVEFTVLQNLRSLSEADQSAVVRLTNALAITSNDQVRT